MCALIAGFIFEILEIYILLNFIQKILGRMDIWLQCWMRQMMNQQRIVTVDESELASELCLAATITYPVPCLCEMIKQVENRDENNFDCFPS